MKRIHQYLAVLSLALTTAAAAPGLIPLTEDLGYLRLSGEEATIGELGHTLAVASALVVDLRQAPANRCADLLQVLSAAGPRKPATLVLIGPSTPTELVSGLAQLPFRPITLGMAGTKPAPDVAVAQTAEAEASALAALASGTSVANLISGRIDKERYDEAALVKDFTNGSRDPRPPQAEPSSVASAATPARPVDRVLQRAVQLHEALKASR